MSAMLSMRSREVKVAHDIPISRISLFWEGLKQGKVLATRCNKCGKTYFPPAADCSQCLSSDMEWVELSNEATIETFTYVAVKPASFQHEEPYIIAIGRLKEGLRVLAWLKGYDLSEVKVGAKVKLVAKTTLKGDPVYEFIKLE